MQVCICRNSVLPSDLCRFSFLSLMGWKPKPLKALGLLIHYYCHQNSSYHVCENTSDADLCPLNAQPSSGSHLQCLKDLKDLKPSSLLFGYIPSYSGAISRCWTLTVCVAGIFACVSVCVCEFLCAPAYMQMPEMLWISWRGHTQQF